jgi:hypothetical protein
MFAMTYRMMGAFLLDRMTYESVEVERSAGRQAVVVVLLSSLAAGVGAAGWAGPQLFNLVTTAAIALITWLAWAGLILYVGGIVLPERQTKVDYGELVRTTGFAATPGLLQVFALFTPIAIPMFIVSWVWMIAAMVVAVRQALDFSSMWRALAVCVVTLAVVLATTVAVALAFERVLV